MLMFENKTQQEWLDEINAYTVDSQISILVRRVIPNAEFLFAGKPSYATLRMINKPEKDTFDPELVIYIAEELARINQIFADLQIEADLQARIDVLVHAEDAIERVTGGANGKKLLQKLLKELDANLLTQIELEELNIIAEIDAANTLDTARNAARSAIATHKPILAGNPTPGEVAAAVLDLLKILE